MEWSGLSGVGGVEWSGVGGVVFFRKSHMYVHHQIGLNELINMLYLMSRVIDENVRKMAKNRDLKMRIYG